MNIRPTLNSDKKFLIDFFNEDGVLSGFPMASKAEIEDSCLFWLEMALKGYGLSCEMDGVIVAIGVLYIPMYAKLQKGALFSIVVDPLYRNKNIGTTLIKALENLGTGTYGLSIIHLEVYEKNNPAIKLYQKLGYKEYGTQKKFIKENNSYYSKILMEKRFN